MNDETRMPNDEKEIRKYSSTRFNRRCLPAEPIIAMAAMPTGGRTIHAVIVAAIVLVVAVVYWPVRHFGFVRFDDPTNVSREPHVLAGMTRDSFRWAITSHGLGHWVPLVRVNYLLDRQVLGLRAGAMHVENATLHAAASVLVYVMLAVATGSTWRSAVVALLFAAHPMHVESVAWITERRDVLSTPLLLAAIIAYVKFTRGINRRSGWYVAAVGFYALSLTAKAMGITLPVALLLLDWWPLRRLERVGVRRLLVEKVPYVAVMLPVAVAAMWAQHASGATMSVAELPIPARLADACVTGVLYLAKLIFPTGLSPVYVMPANGWSAAQVFCSATVLGVLGWVAARGRRMRPYLWFGLAWFFVTVLPVSGLTQAGFQSMADRYTYLPSIGLFVAVVWGGLDAVRLFTRRPAGVAAVVASAVVVAMATAARTQVGYWRTTRTLFEHADEVTDENWFAHYHLGMEAERDRQYSEAMDWFSKTMAERPSFRDGYLAYADCFQMAAWEKARPAYEAAATRSPDDPAALVNRANGRFAAGDNVGALGDLRRAVAIDPSAANRARLAAMEMAAEDRRGE